MPERKEHRFNLRLTATQEALVKHAAKTAGVSASRFMLDAAVRSAEDVVARQNRFVLPATEWAAFGARLERPAREIEPLGEAAANRGPVGGS